MEDANYNMLLEENKKLHEQLDNLSKRMDDVIAFNKALLNRKGSSSSQEESNEDLGKKLKEGLHK